MWPRGAADHVAVDGYRPAGPRGNIPGPRPPAVTHKCHFRGDHQDSGVLMSGGHAFLRLVEIPQTDAIPVGVFVSQFLSPFDFRQADRSWPLFIGHG